MIDPKELKYTKDDEWIRFEGDVAFVGITDYAQSELGDLVFVNLPEVDDEVVAGEPFGDVESVKAVADVFSPVSGVVLEINEDLLDDAALINNDAWAAWFIKVGNITDTEDFMTADEYDEYRGL
ncbi:MAG: glycine cleavage system protein GcvH [Clostridiales bacterium]|nr:glycine cleavage system protein GcvH [Clostridiales bacterium]